MGRTYGFSATNFKRAISSYNRMQKDKEESRLIEYNNSLSNKTEPHYRIIDFDFDITNRIANIQFEEIKYYKTIERYVTRNYQKYPIYSDWKLKRKTIKKRIKLTNREIENLNTHNDELINSFCDEIIIRINCEDLIPSWFKTKYLYHEMGEEIHQLNFEEYKSVRECQGEIDDLNSDNTKFQITIEKSKTEIEKAERKLNKTRNKIQRINNSKPSIILYIITLSIYYFLTSPKRLTHLNNKADALSDYINNQNIEIQNLNKQILDNNINVDSINRKIQSIKSDYDDKKKRVRGRYISKIERIQPLEETLTEEDKFTPLKNFVGYEYQKIIGCYIIRNTENNKAYVGQSKDIYRRIKQHFKGTEPRNIIFAEDYFTSKLDDKENLFEIKIIPLETKDELDKTERELIELYDACNSGYNGTKGNQ